VIGSGLGKRLASVHWAIAGEMAGGWLLTIPGAALIGAGAWEGAHLFGAGTAGPIVIALMAAALAAALYVFTQRTPVGASDLDRSHVSPEEEASAAGTAVAAAAQSGEPGWRAGCKLDAARAQRDLRTVH
jgi:PiT family inorganic phosphate transporter